MAKDYSNIEGLIGNVKESIRNAYDKGYKQGYKQGFEDGKVQGRNEGLFDAWECARKICNMNYETRREAMDVDDTHDLLGKILNKYSASEAIAKIKEYEEKAKQAENEIKVGDEVKHIERNVSFYVSNVKTDSTCKGGYMLAGLDGFGNLFCIKDSAFWVKTGKRNEKLAEVLEQLKEAQDETK